MVVIIDEGKGLPGAANIPIQEIKKHPDHGDDHSLTSVFHNGTYQNPFINQNQTIMSEVKVQEVKLVPVKFDFDESTVEALKTEYSSLQILNVKDKDGLKVLQTALTHMVSLRTGIDKKRKELNKPASTYKKSVDTEAKRITDILTPIEKDLADKKAIIVNEKVRLAEEAETAERERIQDRTKRLADAGMVFDGVDTYRYGDHTISSDEILTCEDSIIDDMVDTVELAFMSETPAPVEGNAGTELMDGVMEKHGDDGGTAEGDSKQQQGIYYSVYLEIDTDKFEENKQSQQGYERKVDFAFKIDGKEHEVTLSELKEFLRSSD